MIITTIEKKKKNNDQMMIYVDDEYAFSVSEEDYFRLNLYEKKEISQEEIEYIIGTVNLTRAKSKAVRYLSMKIRTENEVRQKLESEGFTLEIIDNAIEDLKSMGYINDMMYAQKYIFDRSKLKPKSKKMLRFELENKGIDRDILDEVFKDWSVDEHILAETLVKKKFGKYNYDDEKVQRKIIAFLQHRGFSHSIVNELINKLKIEEI